MAAMDSDSPEPRNPTLEERLAAWARCYLESGKRGGDWIDSVTAHSTAAVLNEALTEIAVLHEELERSRMLSN